MNNETIQRLVTWLVPMLSKAPPRLKGVPKKARTTKED